MTEAAAQAHLVKAMHRAHQERARAFSAFWGMLWDFSKRRSRVTSSRWA